MHPRSNIFILYHITRSSTDLPVSKPSAFITFQEAGFICFLVLHRPYGNDRKSCLLISWNPPRFIPYVCFRLSLISIPHSPYFVLQMFPPSSSSTSLSLVCTLKVRCASLGRFSASLESLFFTGLGICICRVYGSSLLTVGWVLFRVDEMSRQEGVKFRGGFTSSLSQILKKKRWWETGFGLLPLDFDCLNICHFNGFWKNIQMILVPSLIFVRLGYNVPL